MSTTTPPPPLDIASASAAQLKAYLRARHVLPPDTDAFERKVWRRQHLLQRTLCASVERLRVHELRELVEFWMALGPLWRIDDFPTDYLNRLQTSLLDYKDAWVHHRLLPHNLRDFRSRWTFGGLEYVGMHMPQTTPCPPEKPLAPYASLIAVLPLALLRQWAGPRGAKETDRAVLKPLIAEHVAQMHAASAGCVQVIPAHLPLLVALYPAISYNKEHRKRARAEAEAEGEEGEERDEAIVKAVNTWLAPTGTRFCLVPRYTYLPRPLPPFPWTCTTVVQPFALHRAAIQVNAPYYFSSSVLHVEPKGLNQVVERLSRWSVEPTFTFSDSYLNMPAADTTDSYLNDFRDMSPQQYVLFGTLHHSRPISIAELYGHLSTHQAMRVFDPDVLSTDEYHPAQVQDLLDVLKRYRDRIVRRLDIDDTDATADLALLIPLVERLKAEQLECMRLTKEMVAQMSELDAAERSDVEAFLTALQQFSAYCLHWKGPGHPWPKVGDAVTHLADTVDVEQRMYEQALPPVIDALHALPAALRATVQSLPTYNSHTTVNPTATIKSTLSALQQRDTSEAHCIRLVAPALWITATKYAAMFLHVTLPAYQ